MKLLNTILSLIAVGLLCSCVQKTHLKTVTFRVNMNSTEHPQDVGIRGNFTSNPWNETIPMTSPNNDGVYEVTIEESTAVNAIEFKFVNTNNDFELKGQDNRTLVFKYQPETLVYEAEFNNPEGTQTSIQ